MATTKLRLAEVHAGGLLAKIKSRKNLSSLRTNVNLLTAELGKARREAYLYYAHEMHYELRHPVKFMVK